MYYRCTCHIFFIAGDTWSKVSGYRWSRLTPSCYRCGNAALGEEKDLSKVTQPENQICWVYPALFPPWYLVASKHQRKRWWWRQSMWPLKCGKFWKWNPLKILTLITIVFWHKVQKQGLDLSQKSGPHLQYGRVYLVGSDCWYKCETHS